MIKFKIKRIRVKLEFFTPHPATTREGLSKLSISLQLHSLTIHPDNIMAVFFNKVQRSDPRDPAAPRKWYLILKSLSTKRTKEIAQRMADETTMNPKEVEMALYLLVKVMKNTLKEGSTVQIDDLGTFYLTGNSSPSDTEEEVTAHNCNAIHIRFRPDEALQAEINKVRLKPADKLI
jgi:predicted histone-like DNA-binding protein